MKIPLQYFFDPPDIIIARFNYIRLHRKIVAEQYFTFSISFVHVQYHSLQILCCNKLKLGSSIVHPLVSGKGMHIFLQLPPTCKRLDNLPTSQLQH